jgi:hypothetical protein
MRISKRRCCSSSVIENQYLMRTKELLDVVVGAEAHDTLDAGAVVPAPIEEHDLPARRQVRDVALEVPLRPFALVRSGEGGDVAHARVEPLRDALDRAPLAGRIAPLEDDDDLELLVLDPVLQLHELSLQSEELLEIVTAVHRVRVGRVREIAQELAEALVIELHLELFVEAIDPFGAHAFLKCVPFSCLAHEVGSLSESLVRSCCGFVNKRKR